MTWLDFLEKATSHFADASDVGVTLGYRFGGHMEPRKMLRLACQSEWDGAMEKMRKKAGSARTRAANLELKDLVSDSLST
jgi:hypothetical protein